MNSPVLDDAFGKLLVRLTVGVLMLFHGIAKLMNPGAIEHIGGMLTAVGLPSVLVYGIYLGEIIAPLMAIAGYFARLAGMIMVVNMLFAIGLAHTADIFALTQHGGWRLELQGFYLFGSLAIAFLGSGRIAVRPD